MVCFLIKCHTILAILVVLRLQNINANQMFISFTTSKPIIYILNTRVTPYTNWVDIGLVSKENLFAGVISQIPEFTSLVYTACDECVLVWSQWHGHDISCVGLIYVYGLLARLQVPDAAAKTQNSIRNLSKYHIGRKRNLVFMCLYFIFNIVELN